MSGNRVTVGLMFSLFAYEHVPPLCMTPVNGSACALTALQLSL